ncbi:MAG TPA: MBL fold metallo-hydrolase [Jatrophihabitans sp.]|jgi:ribonuclease BN (tRNA processing enzyme)
MRLHFCGTRGSTPVSGLTQGRYGGRTSALALAHEGEPPTLVLDAGTGLTQVSALLDDGPYRGTLLLGHLHWDHTHGMPFFAAGLQPGHRVEVVIPEQGTDAEEVLARAFSPPHFPVRPSELGTGWTFRGLEPGTHQLEGFTVQALEIPHKGGRTFGFRVSDGASSLAYLSDHSPLGCGPGEDGLGELHAAARELAAGVDLLIHDAQHTPEELPDLAFLGHSATDYPVNLALAAGARAVMLYHHAPTRTDDEIDAMTTRFVDAGVPVFAAFDGLVVDLPGLTLTR